MTIKGHYWDQIIIELEAIVGHDFVATDEVDRIGYGVDYFWVPRALIDRGKELPLPDVVVQPNTVGEVSEVVKLANVYRIPVVPYGGGSGSQGGIMAVHGGITLDLKRLNRIIEINEMSQTVAAQAGINGYELEQALNQAGFTLPHYPASVHSATLGGYLASRGSGVLSTKYGKAEDMVLSVQVVLPNGDIVRTLPVPNHAAGPGILQIFVGAEGSYGIITEATMQLERLPEERRFQAFLFPNLHSGLEAGRKVMLNRLEPTVIRLYDEPSTRTRLEKVLGLDAEGAYMVMGFDGFPEIVEAQEKRATHICLAHNAEILGRESGEHWWQHRYDFYFPPMVLAEPWLFGTTDTLSTYDKIENLYWTKKRAIQEQFSDYDIKYIAHFSHWFAWGVMVYDRFIIEQPPEDAGEVLRLHNQIWDLAVQKSLECGGLINEHHGVGLKLARHMRKQYGPAFQVLEALKYGLDANNVMNPGKMGFGSFIQR
ncbi:MAG: alkylglycerone-phosphate synthase [Dehalococcoidales bacterium]|jgi:alkyldihydroxyacetonephosphate synthase|nr:alkylglycerone-phosphate synthase [Dehalococcoidales bacterium]